MHKNSSKHVGSNDPKEIAQKLLGIKVDTCEGLTPHRLQNTYKCVVEDGRKVVLKKTNRGEVSNHRVADRLRLGSPKVLAGPLEPSKEDDEVWYVQEFIEGERLDHLIRSGKPSCKFAVEKTIERLVKIQDSLEDFESELGHVLHCYTCKDNLSEEFAERYEEITLPTLEKQGLRDIYKRLQSYDWENLLATLETNDSNSVLIRWDYKPDNLLFSKDRNVYSLDWAKVMKGSRWIDLAFLLGDLDREERAAYFEYYSKKSGLNQNSEKFDNALRLVNLIHMSANCKLLMKDPNNKDNYLKNIKRHAKLLFDY